MKRCPAAFSGEEFNERRREFVADDLVIDYVDPLEDRLIELLPSVIRRATVQLRGICEEIQVRVDVRECSAKVLVDTTQLGGELFALPRNLVQFHFDASGGDLAVGGEVDEVLLLYGQLPNLRLELLSQELLGSGLVGDRRFEPFPHRGDEVAVELKGLEWASMACSTRSRFE